MRGRYGFGLFTRLVILSHVREQLYRYRMGINIGVFCKAMSRAIHQLSEPATTDLKHMTGIAKIDYL